VSLRDGDRAVHRQERDLMLALAHARAVANDGDADNGADDRLPVVLWTTAPSSSMRMSRAKAGTWVIRANRS
jgi:hypothetical protein